MEPIELSPIESSWQSVLAQAGSGNCLEADELITLAQRGRRAARYAEHIAHISSCSGCRETLLRLKLRQRRPNHVRLAWLAAPALAASAIAFALLRQGNHVEPELQSRVVSPSSGRQVDADRTPALKSAPSESVQAARGSSTSPQKHSPSVKLRIGGLVAFNDGKWSENGLRLPSFAVRDVEQILSPPSTLRGTKVGESVQLTFPDSSQRALRNPFSRIEWLEVPNAIGYKVAVARRSGTDWQPLNIGVDGTKADILDKISAGDKVRISIEPMLDPVAAPADQVASVTTYDFTILAPEQLKQADWATQNAKRAPIAASMVLFRLGLAVEAEKVLPRSAPKGFSPWAEAIRRESLYDRPLDH